ncbi:hypothetical protein [Neolewinella antarctica]|uniref:DUF4380 domain-containing protein n=1 Tax=Neolewinella antarctica TaxID=442734 RepID=A0ABX0X8G5_9BACT|nr:hypothetical protein [Neolewinella antarctica]NJC25546.1 hypothetical protein [Neolewinella antarctica]
MRSFTVCLCLVLFASCQSSDAPAPVALGAPEGAVPAGPITLAGGKVSVTIDPAYGARITSYTYDGREILNQSREQNGRMFGSTVWTSPQEDWDWPPPPAFDTQPYEVRKLRENVYVFTSERDSASQLRLEKRIQLTQAGELGLGYEVKNESYLPLAVAAWENTRLPYAGRLEFYVGDTAWTNEGPLPLEMREELAVIPFDDQVAEPQKFYATLRDTMVRYYNDGLVFTKQTMITGRNQVAPGQAPLEVYLNPVLGFAEFELQGGYYRLEPGQSASMRTKWLVQPE